MSNEKKIVLTRCPVGNATEIALQKGWLVEEFGKRQVQFNLLQELPRSEWVKHFTQEPPLTFRDGGNIPPIWAQANGIETRVIGFNFLRHTQAILVKNDSKIVDFRQLKRRRVALPRRLNDKVDFWWATVKRGWLTALAAHGFSEEDVEFIDLPVEKSYLADRKYDTANALFDHNKNGRTFLQVEAEALLNGQVDSIYAAGGRATEIVDAGIGRIIFDVAKQPGLSQINNLFPTVITVGEEFARNHPELVRVYLEQLIRAGIWARSHREETIEIFAKRTYVSKEAAAISRSADFHEYLILEITNEAIAALESQKNFLLKQNFIQNDFDVRDWVDRSFLESLLETTIA